MFLSLALAFQFVSIPAPKIQGIFKKYKENVGLSIRSLDGAEVFSLNSNKLFKPASIEKTISSACVFETLGTDFKFKTPVMIRGEIKNHVLNGDLIIKGAGDFSLVIEDLKIMIEKIYHLFGIHEITGKLIIDTSYLTNGKIEIFDDFAGDAGRSFSAVLTSLPINHNSFAVWINPLDASASLFPFGAVDLKLNVSLKKVPGRLNGSKTNLGYDFEGKKLNISGVVGSEDPPKAYYRASPDPYLSFANLFTYNFGVLGGKFSGKYALVSSSSGAQELFIHESRSLSRLFIDINKLSTNFGAEMSAVAAASKAYRGKSISGKDLENFVRNCPKVLGMNSEKVILKNASGLSRDSKVSPTELTGLLAQIPNRDYGPEFLSSLSILGKDGTTRHWLKDLAGRARLKTGSIKGVQSLAGYVYSKDSRVYAFTLILNCSSCDIPQWRKDEMEFLRLLIGGS